MIFVTKNLKIIFKPEYKSKILSLLACIFDSKLLKDCPGVYHTYTAVFQFIADNCLDFLAHDVCTLQVFMDECTFIENPGVDQFDVELNEETRAALMPELFAIILKAWHKRAKNTLAEDNDWRYLPVTQLVTVAVRRFKEVIGVQKPGAKVLKKNENWFCLPGEKKQVADSLLMLMNYCIKNVPAPTKTGDIKKTYFNQIEKILHSILSNYESACLKPYSATMFKISNTII